MEASSPPAEFDPERFSELSGTLLAVAGFDLEIRWLSPSLPATLGYAPGELIGTSFVDLVHPEDLERTAQAVGQLLQGEELSGFEYRTRAADGSYRSFIFNALGSVEEQLIYATATDATELRDAQRLIQSAFADAPLATVLISVSPQAFGLLTQANAAACRFLGHDEQKLVSMNFTSLVHRDDLDDVLAALGPLIQGEVDHVEFEKRLLHADGSTLWSRKHVSLIRDSAGEAAFLIGQMEDVTDRRRAEEEAIAAERRFEQIFANAPIGMALQDADGRYLHVNWALCGIFRRSRAELLEMRFLDLVHPDDIAADEELRLRMLRGEARVAHREKRFRRADGTWIDARVSISAVSAGEKTNFIVQVEDITDRKEVDRVVRRGRQRLQAIIDGMPSAVFVKDLEGRYEVVNVTLAAFLGRRPQDVVGMVDRDLFPAEAVDRFHQVEAQALASDTPVTIEETFSGEDGQRTYLMHVFALRDGEGRPTSIAGAGIEISDRVRADDERRALEARAQEAQRLETVGRLAGGVAHDFNNLLAVILNNAALAADEVAEGSQARSDLDEVRTAAERAAELTHQLVQFSRQDIVAPEVLDPNDAVRRAERLLARVIGEDVAFRTEIGDDVPPIEIDPGQLERVLLNLALNARDAMPEGGALNIVTDRVEIAGQPYARLAVCDTGTGMADDVAARAFEPFFTTKPPGAGTGLGLATVYGIVKQAGGTIELESRAGEGTDVVMRFPAARSAPSRGRPPDEPEVSGGGERVLVVEDEDSVRRLAARLLRDAGYEVTEFSGATEALAGLEDGGPVDLLLTDVVMPGTSGRELAERLTQASPETAVLFMSGYTDDVVVRHGVEGEGGSFLPKPFSRASLLQAVSQALAARRGAPGPAEGAQG